MRSSKRRAVALFGVAAVVLAGAGCGTSSSGGAGGAKAPVPASQNQINAMSRDKVQDGGKLTWPIDNVPANFNYNEIDGTNANAAVIINALLPAPFNFNAAGDPTVDKNYVLSTDVKTDPTQVVTYELNPKAVWSDGKPVTWADYQAEWQATNGTNTAYQVSSTTGYDQIASVTRGKNDYEVIVTFKKRYADWQALFSPLYPASTDREPTVFNNGWKYRPLTSAGPFRFDSFDPTAKTYTLVRNEKWWGDRAKLDSIVFRTIPDDAQPDALANGEIDFQDIGPNVDYYNRAKAMSGVEIRVAGGPNFRHLTINGQSSELTNVNVRRALAMAIDRSAIAKAELGPLGVDPVPLNNHIFMENQTGYQDNSGDAGKFNPTKAKELLDAAGWKVSGKQRVKDGKPLAINMVIPSGTAVSKSEAELIQNMLQQVNVTVNINTVPLDDFFDKYVTPGQFDFTVFSWLGTQFPISSSMSIYAKPNGSNIQQNYARVGSDEIDNLFRQASEELDRTKALQLANQADALIWQEVHSLTLYQRPDLWATKKNLANFGAFGFANIIYENIGWAKS